MPINVVLDRLILGLMLAIVLTIGSPIAVVLWGQSHPRVSRNVPPASAPGVASPHVTRGV